MSVICATCCVLPAVTPAFIRFKVSVALIKQLLKTTAFNMIFINFLNCNLFYLLRRLRNTPIGPELPTVVDFIKQMVVIVVVQEIGFYYSHRLFHHPKLYKTIHKKHHEWTAPTSVSSMYCHPLEQWISNLIPLTFGPLIGNAHTFTTLIWYTTAMLTTTLHHSGYKVPLASNEFHDFHHEIFNQNFGILGILDWIHGTDTIYRQKRLK